MITPNDMTRTEALLKRFGLEYRKQTTEEIKGSAVLPVDTYCVTGELESLPAYIVTNCVAIAGRSGKHLGKPMMDSGSAALEFTERGFVRFLDTIEHFLTRQEEEADFTQILARGGDYHDDADHYHYFD